MWRRYDGALCLLVQSGRNEAINNVDIPYDVILQILRRLLQAVLVCEDAKNGIITSI